MSILYMLKRYGPKPMVHNLWIQWRILVSDDSVIYIENFKRPEIFILKLIKVYVLLVFWKFPVWVNSIFGAVSGSLSFLSGIRKLSRGVNLHKSEWLMIIFFEIRWKVSVDKIVFMSTKFIRIVWPNLTGYENLPD